MSHLAKLTITQVKRGSQLSPQQSRRNKLIARLQEQLALVEAQAKGERFFVTKPSWTRDENGNKSRVQQQRQIRPWWWQQDNQLHMVVRYGARQLELAKGKRAITIASLAVLPGAINTLILATQAGELDAAIAAAVDARKFKSNPL
jgi:hypothetical protein